MLVDWFCCDLTERTWPIVEKKGLCAADVCRILLGLLSFTVNENQAQASRGMYPRI